LNSLCVRSYNVLQIQIYLRVTIFDIIMISIKNPTYTDIRNELINIAKKEDKIDITKDESDITTLRKGIQLKIKLIKNSKKHGQSYIEISNRSYNISDIKEIIFDDGKIHIDYPKEKRNK